MSETLVPATTAAEPVMTASSSGAFGSLAKRGVLFFFFFARCSARRAPPRGDARLAEHRRPEGGGGDVARVVLLGAGRRHGRFVVRCLRRHAVPAADPKRVARRAFVSETVGDCFVSRVRNAGFAADRLSRLERAPPKRLNEVGFLFAPPQRLMQLRGVVAVVTI